MSILFNADDDQIKVTLSSALTIGTTSDYVVSFWVYYTSLPANLGLTMALLDVDPSGSGRRIMWTDDGSAIYADEDDGGIGSYTVSATTGYFVVFQRTTTTDLLRIFPDSSSTTPLNGGGSGDTATDTADLSALDTVIFGDINPSARVAMRMEAISLKIQTGISGGWSDSECRTESTKYAIQKAGGTERLAWRLSSATADTNGYYEIGGSGPNFSGTGGTITTGSWYPSQLESLVTTYQHSGTDGAKLSDALSYNVRPSPSTCRIVSVL